MPERFFSSRLIENNLYYVTAPKDAGPNQIKRYLIRKLWDQYPLWNIGTSNLRIIGYTKNGDGDYRHSLVELVEGR